MDINWSKVFFSETFYGRLDSMVKRSIVDEITAEEAVTYIIQALSDNNWEKCRSFSGKSAPDTYLYSMCSNLIIDYARKIYGRQRPPAWLKQKGEVWLAVWKELCLDRHATEFIVNRHTRDGFRDRDAIDIIIKAIKAKLPWCGVSIRPESIEDETEHFLPDALISHDDDIHERMAFEQALQFAHLLLHDPAEESQGSNPLSSESSGDLYNAISSIQLTSEEMLVLRMYFCDGISGSKIAQALHMPNHRPVRLIKEIMEKAQAELSKIGVDLSPV